MDPQVLLAAAAGAAGASAFFLASSGSRLARWLPLPRLGGKPKGLVDVRQVKNPHPDWQPGQKLPHPFENRERIELDPAQLGAGLYPFVISAVVPRPIAFISSLSKEGVGNLSPYSYFGVMSHDPPYVTIGTCATGGRPNGMKDSQQNILETGEFTLNMMSEWFLEAANHTCGNYDRGVNEIELAGLTPTPSVRVKPPRIEEAAVQLECKLRHSYPVKNSKGEVTATIIIGEVVLVHVLEAVTGKTGHGHVFVEFDKYAPVSRLGGNTYARITETYDLPRPGKEWQQRDAMVSKAKN
ncbi:hypothetical protein COCSUDRAFT_54305 [Coccomyxa subellipsoidea C-169]|uniref:Flavin reductase like domain-containing protein n=1 Tax=Coccomyxa subellipsoidea (strain C-169) TaxID=574566 RepID=I0YPP5_COCSC|nr:hypothetical protein COCSUDRAFT_54305 [Coccomyxa subellipsoidea C-169]EIE20364.1 hypothetical protein COCSUDRAFT_54305 [Coccomyxa subellipsoidea C-169]|eukprot:XP_005644908.1 hypothetical protein COCSUDRAFT_54305 [Coccomyxa subellipsoidea C-169]